MRNLFDLHSERMVLVEILERLGYLYRHHSAWRDGYISRRCSGIVDDYHGRFGHGYRVAKPCWTSTRFHTVIYYIWTNHDYESSREIMENILTHTIRDDLRMGGHSYD